MDAPRRVLVVDDDEDAAAILTLLLQHDGHEVRACPDGRSALALAPHFRPEVVVLDLRLTDMSGYRLASALRSAEGTRDAVLVAVTGLDGEDVRERCRAAGVDCHLVKPIADLARFRALIGSLQVHEDLRLA